MPPRAYYAAFYAMEAALLVHNVHATSHSGVISDFSKLFLKTEILPKELGKTLGNLFRERQTADYQYLAVITAEEAEADCLGAELALSSICRYLKEEGFLDD